jgi:hypothetical protein
MMPDIRAVLADDVTALIRTEAQLRGAWLTRRRFADG